MPKKVRYKNFKMTQYTTQALLGLKKANKFMAKFVKI